MGLSVWLDTGLVGVVSSAGFRLGGFVGLARFRLGGFGCLARFRFVSLAGFGGDGFEKVLF